jgi:hypothetical protein
MHLEMLCVMWFDKCARQLANRLDKRIQDPNSNRRLAAIDGSLRRVEGRDEPLGNPRLGDVAMMGCMLHTFAQSLDGRRMRTFMHHLSPRWSDQSETDCEQGEQGEQELHCRPPSLCA